MRRLSASVVAVLASVWLLVPCERVLYAAAARVGTPVTTFNENSAASSITTASMSVTTGNTLVVTADIYSPTTEEINSVTDSGGSNTYTALTACEDTVNNRLRTFYAVGVTGGTLTFTATFSATTLYSTIVASEYSGVGAFDAEVPCTTGNGTAVASSTFTTTGPGFIYAAALSFDNSSTQTAGTNYTLRTSQFFNGRGYSEDWVTSSAQVGTTATTTQSASTYWRIAGASFVELSAGPLRLLGVGR